MPISINYKAIFVHIPKTGGRSVNSMLKLRQHQDVTRSYFGVELGLVLTHLTISQIKSRMDIGEYYVFAFVRNPYTRILSEYNWRMRNRTAFEEPTGKMMSFGAYCELLLSKWHQLMNNPNRSNVEITNIQHIRPQGDYVDGDVDIYRHEDFINECLKIQDRIGMTRKPVPMLNVGKYKTVHTPRTIEITNALYEYDFELFNYKMI